MQNSKQKSPMPIRLPDDLQAWVKARAEANIRSVNAEIIALLLQIREAELLQASNVR